MFQPKSQTRYFTSRESDVDSSKLKGTDKPGSGTSTSDPGEKTPASPEKSQSESPGPSTTDVLDLSQPSKESQTTTELKWNQALDLSTDKIMPETGMTLHPRPKHDNKESKESTSATPTPPSDTPKSPDSSKREFKIKVIGVKRHKPKYSFKCNICEQIMHSVKEGNMHHCKQHGDVVLKCEDCDKGFVVPSSLGDHRYNHRGQAFECESCHQKFTFYSGLQLHHNLHASSQMHICFTGNCGKKYHWPQALLHHLGHHCNCNYKCDLCAYESLEERLLK